MINSDVSVQARRLIFSSSRLVKGIFTGMYRSAFRGPGQEFEDVRHYVEGDDIRNVDWNTSARTGTLFSKNFREERELPVFILFDVSRSMDYGSSGVSKRRGAATAAALFSFAAAYNHDKVGAVLFSDCMEKWIEPETGTRHASRLVSDFLDYQPRGKGSDLNRSMKAVYTSSVKRGICFIVSDFKSGLDVKMLQALSMKHDLIAVRVFDPAETHFPAVGLTTLVDPESGKSYPVRTRRDEKRNTMNTLLAEPAERLRNAAKKVPADIIDLDIRQDVFPQLLFFFRHR